MNEIFCNQREIRITLPHSLKWNEREIYAKNLIKQGYDLVWDFHFPIIPPIDEMIMSSWEFTLNYFTKHFFPLFEKETKGVILYQGFADFKDQGQCESLKNRLLCRDQGFQVLKELSPHLPDTIPLYVLFKKMDLILMEWSYDYFTLGAKDAFFPIGEWDGSFFKKTYEKKLTVGILLPTLNSLKDAEFQQVYHFIERNLDCRVIPETLLTHQWHGLDQLFVFPHLLSLQGRRKILGFEAAGGSVCNIQ